MEKVEEEEGIEPIKPQFPTGRVKNIRDIKKVNSETLFLVTCSSKAAKEKKCRIVKLERLRTAVKKHHLTSDYLIDSLPVPSQPSDRPATERSRSRSVAIQPAPAGTRRIDYFFHKQAN